MYLLNQGEVDMADWALEEVRHVELGDRRLNRRMMMLLNRLSDNPQLSIPAACRGWAETMAAYRFLDNEETSCDRILEGHYEATLERMARFPVVLLVQDTTDLAYTRQRAAGLGTIKNVEKRELLLHETVAMTPDRLMLGSVEVQLWERGEQIPKKEKRLLRVDQKESYYWIESYKRSCSLQGVLQGVTLINVADGAGDIYELFEEASRHEAGDRADWIVRAEQYNRRAKAQTGENTTLEKMLRASAVLIENRFTLEAAPGRKKREVRLQIRGCGIELIPPRRPSGHHLNPQRVFAVLAEEVDAPEDPLSWLLLTSLPVTTAEEAMKVVSYYKARWEIELFFRVLKQGCQVENLDLRNDKRLYCALALYIIIAWRVLFVKWLSRSVTDAKADLAFTQEEWEAVYIVVGRRSPPKETPELKEVVVMVASLGGYLNRKRDGPPGAKALWIGLQRLTEYVIAIKSYKAII